MEQTDRFQSRSPGSEKEILTVLNHSGYYINDAITQIEIRISKKLLKGSKKKKESENY